jgi:diguanylate cyclase
MQKLLQPIFSFESPQYFLGDKARSNFIDWDKPSRQVQISVMTGLTALLYLVFTLIDKSWAPADVQLLMLKLHLLIVVPMLLMISYLAYQKRYYNIVMYMLAIYSVISISCHAYISIQFVNFGPFLIEGYLGVLWIFIVSGLTFKYAIISATISSIILLTAAFFSMRESDLYIMHSFWIFCSFSFGFFGALIYERSREAIFISQQELHHLAITDPLTGVFNRNQLNKTISQEISRAIRYDSSFGFLMVDVDHFKRINDNFGHDEGDKVLQNIAKLLCSSLRKNDTLIRWGGEEFVVIAVEVDELNLMLLCDKLLQKIEASCYNSIDKVTVSIGATLFKKADLQGDLLSRADKALYQAKDKGRNTAVYL